MRGFSKRNSQTISLRRSPESPDKAYRSSRSDFSHYLKLRCQNFHSRTAERLLSERMDVRLVLEAWEMRNKDGKSCSLGVWAATESVENEDLARG